MKLHPVRDRVRRCGLVAAALLVLSPAPPATATPAYLGPWIVVPPGDQRIEALGRLLPGKVSPNAPGILLDVPPASFPTPEAVASTRRLVADARRAGWQSGLAIDLPDADVPTDPRAAETSSPESLYPGLGKLLSAAQGADLFVLGFPRLEEEDLPARRFVLRKVAASIRAENPSTRIALVFHRTANPEFFFAPVVRDLLRDDVAAYVDAVGLHSPSSVPDPGTLRAAMAPLGPRPLVLIAPPQASAAALADLAARYAREGVFAVAAPLLSPHVEDEALRRLGVVLSGDFGPDSRVATAEGKGGIPLRAERLVSGVDLGGTILVPGLTAAGEPYRGIVTLKLDAPSYSAFDVVELASGRSGRFEIPRTSEPPTLTLSTAGGPVALVLTARERLPTEAQSARVETTALRGITAEEILARHQAWRSARDARWGRLTARNETSYRIRVAELNQSMELTIAGAFFFEPGKGYDWSWEEAFFNGVRWPGKKVPELPLLQPEKVSELPLELTFGDAYRYRLEGEDMVQGLPCWRLGFVPVSEFSNKPVYEGEVWISRSDFSVVKARARQKNLTGDVQSVDETTDFEEIVEAGGGPAMRFPVHVKGQTIFRTFSRTTVIERETRLTSVLLDPADFEARKAAAFASEKVMVRDTDRGVRYLEKTKDGGRRPADRAKSSQLFGLGGVYYDRSFDYPLPLLGVYYVDLDAGRKGQQTQVFFGGVILAGSWNLTQLFGTRIEAGVDVFGAAIRGTDVPWADGEKIDAEAVKQRSFAFNLNLAYPIVPHVKAALTVGASYRDFAEGDDTAPAFRVPSDHWLYRVEGRLTWDVAGYALSGRYGVNRRAKWEAWGYPGNPDWDSGKDSFRNWNVTLAKDFALPGFQRITTSATWAGTQNADRFSKIGFGNFGGTSLVGFAAGSLRAEKTLILRASYGLMAGRIFRLSALYDHALVWDAAEGYEGTTFGGAGINGQLPGPWATLLQLTAGLPVVGRDRGQTGVFVNFGILKIF